MHYHPDDAFELRLEQEQKVLELLAATRTSGNELLLEIICPRAMMAAGTEDAAALRAVKRFYNLGVKPEWWKLAPMQENGWAALQALITQRDPYCRGAVILGLNQPIAHLAASFRCATNPIVKGFMVGRTMWADASLSWLKEELDDTGLIQAVSHNFGILVEAWRTRHLPALDRV